jgi:hypothetical protein
VDAIGLGSQSASIATGGAATRPRWRGSRRCRECRAAGSPSGKAEGFLRERLDMSVRDAFGLLRPHARNRRDHLTEVSRRLISEPDARPALLQAMSQIAAAPPP